jgi:hypothetical protein
MRRVEEAKVARSIYWHVPVKEKVTSTETQITRNTRNETTSQEPRRLATAQISIRRHPEDVNVPSSGVNRLDFGTSRGVPAEEETTAEEQLLAETAMSSIPHRPVHRRMGHARNAESDSPAHRAGNRPATYSHGRQLCPYAGQRS